jgi:hypothetical protein
MRCLLVDTGSKLILIDTGTGDKQLDYLKFYGFQNVIDFDTELQKLGYTCADITDVIFTHLHFDHCGGATKHDANKQIELVFPNATHWVGQKQWDNFLNPNVREGDSYFSENMLPVKEAGKLRLVTENETVCPEVENSDFRWTYRWAIGQLYSIRRKNGGVCGRCDSACCQYSHCMGFGLRYFSHYGNVGEKNTASGSCR